MKKLILLLLIPFLFFSQSIIEKPDGWFDYSGGNEETLNRINIFGKTLTDEIIQNSGLELKEFTELAYFTKYDLYKHDSDKTIPTVRTYLLKNYLQKNLAELQDYYVGERVVKELQQAGYINVQVVKDGINFKDGVIEIFRTYDYLNQRLNIIEKHTSRQYVFFISESYYALVFMNDTEADKCSDEYAKLRTEIIRYSKSLSSTKSINVVEEVLMKVPEDILIRKARLQKKNDENKLANSSITDVGKVALDNRFEIIIGFIKNGGWIILIVIFWRLFRKSKTKPIDLTEDDNNKEVVESSSLKEKQILNQSKSLEAEKTSEENKEDIEVDDSSKLQSELLPSNHDKNILKKILPYLSKAPVFIFIFLNISFSLDFLLNLRTGNKKSILYRFDSWLNNLGFEPSVLELDFNKFISFEAILITLIILFTHLFYFKYSLKKLFNYSLLFTLIVLLIYFSVDDEIIKRTRRLQF